VIAMIVRMRGAFAPADVRSEDSSDSEIKDEGA
jgi:hypothetical protein